MSERFKVEDTNKRITIIQSAFKVRDKVERFVLAVGSISLVFGVFLTGLFIYDYSSCQPIFGTIACSNILSQFLPLTVPYILIGIALVSLRFRREHPSEVNSEKSEVA